MKNKEFIHGAFIGMAGAIAGVIIFQLAGIHVLSIGEGILSKEKYVRKLEYIEKMVDENYLGEIDRDKLAEGLYAGYLSGLEDPYSYYYTAEEYEEENTYTEGSYVGIGVTLQKNEDGGTKIIEVYEGYPGDQAGLEAGDLITGVNGVDVTDLSTSDVAALVRGAKEDTVVLTIYKEEASEPLDVEVTLDMVTLTAVRSELLEDGIGYIQIEQFSGVAPEQFEEAYQELQEQGMQALVVDLRDNPGGLLDSVCDILEQILPEGLIVYIEDKYGEREEISCKGETPIAIPLAVLINGNSASASEIFAGAVKDYEIGTLVGTTSFGKGVVQAIRRLEDGSAVKLTVANYFTPKGNNIHKIGIDPDVEVKLADSLLNRTEFSREEDNQLQEAMQILRDEMAQENK